MEPNNTETTKEYNLGIVNKDSQSMEYVRNYPNLYEKHPHSDSIVLKHSNVFINEGNIQEIAIVPETAIRIGPIICQEHNIYENVNSKSHNEIVSGEFMNRTEDYKGQILDSTSKQFHYINKQNNSDYHTTNIANQDKLVSNFPSREFDLIEPQFVTLDRQQILQPNLYANIQPITHFQQQKSIVDGHNVLFHSKQTNVDYQSNNTKQMNIDYQQNNANQNAFSQKQITNNSIIIPVNDSNKNYNNSLNAKVNPSTVNHYDSDSNNYSLTTNQNQKIKNVKKPIKQYNCTVCDTTFNTISQLNLHKKDVHRSVDKNKNDKTFSCSECSFVTKYSSALKRHKDIHTSSRIFECPTCGKIYNQLFNLKTHQRIHAGQKIYSCEECDFITPYHYSLKRHKIFHTGEKAFSCFVCNKKFSAAPDLKRHLRSHTGQKPYLCNLCGRLFRQTGHLKFHRSKHHPDHVEDVNKSKPVFKIRINLPNPLISNGRSTSDSNILEIKSTDPTIDISRIVDKSKINILPVKMEKFDSPLKFSTESRLKKAIQKQTPFENSNQIVTYIRPQKPVERKKSFHCELCSQSFNSSRHLSVHNKIHQGEKSFCCEICNFVTLHPSSLRKHKRSHLLRKFSCLNCNAAFTTEDRLKIHLKTHELNKKYSCDRCDFVSSYASALNRHKLTHNVDKPFKCDVCNKKFSQEFHLNSHKRLHSGKKVYKCDECSFVTPYHYSLKRHKISHSGIKPYPCTFCDAAFAGAEDLKRHIRAHLGEKPFFCNICGRLFSQAAHVKNHKKKHFVNPETKKMKKCSDCGDTFTDLASLRQHKNTLHKGNVLDQFTQ